MSFGEEQPYLGTYQQIGTNHMCDPAGGKLAGDKLIRSFVADKETCSQSCLVDDSC